MKTMILLFFTILSAQVSAQSLEKLLWDSVSDCDVATSPSDDEPEDYESPRTVDFQLKNGYLSISGSWPTCGCGCDATVAGFKDEKGVFTMLKYESWSCDDKFGIYTSRKIEDVFPANFGLSSFIEGEHKLELNGNSYFYLEAEIPAKGTETPVYLHLFPLGMVGKSNSGLSYNTNGINIDGMIENVLNGVQSIIKALENVQQLELLLKKDFQKLPKKIQDLIDSEIREERFKSKEDFSANLSLLNEAYKAYAQLSYTNMILAWDKKASRFTIKSKSEAPKKMDFLEFLKTMDYYSVKC